MSIEQDKSNEIKRVTDDKESAEMKARPAGVLVAPPEVLAKIGDFDDIFHAHVTREAYASRKTPADVEGRTAAAAFMAYTGSAHEFITKLRAISCGSDVKAFTSMDRMNASLANAQKVVTHETPLLKLLVDAEIEATRARVLAIGRLLGEPLFVHRLSWDERDALTYIINMSRDLC